MLQGNKCQSALVNIIGFADINMFKAWCAMELPTTYEIYQSLKIVIIIKLNALIGISVTLSAQKVDGKMRYKYNLQFIH